MSKHLRKLCIMRHGERIDFVFGKSWFADSFNNGEYVRKNLNMPAKIPNRSEEEYFFDSPLTSVGNFQTTLTGEAFKYHGIKFSHVFCSPSLRCLESCSNVLKGAQQTELPIHIEPGFFEFLGWYKNIPSWMNVEEMLSFGFNVSKEYTSVYSVEDLHRTCKENWEDYYARNFTTTKKIIEAFSGNILLVAHAASLDACSRHLRNISDWNPIELQNRVKDIPYASTAVLEERADKTWHLIQSPFLSIKHSKNDALNYGLLE